MRELLTETKPELLKEWLYPKNKGLDPEELYTNSSVKVWWQCTQNEKHQWETSVRRRAIEGNGCPYCSGRRVLPEDSFAAKHPDLAQEVHPTKNGDFNPNEVAPFSNKKIWWQCQNNPDHIWKVAIGSRVRHKSGCRQCNNLKSPVSDARPDLVQEWHPTLNKLKPHEVTIGSKIDIWWQCTKNPEHIWKTKLQTRSRGIAGTCPQCKKASKEKRMLADFRPDLLSEWHPTKNTGIDPHKVAHASSKKVWWKCKTNPEHEWESSIRNRAVLGSGCPQCNNHGKQPAKGKSLADTHPEITSEWHPNKNGNLHPTDVSYGSAKRVWWQCKADSTHEWDATVTSRTAKNSKHKCPYCSGHFVTEKNSLKTNFPEIAAEWHGEKNGDLTPEKVSKASAKKVWWQCPNNPTHAYQSQIKNRTLLSTGCPVCFRDVQMRRLQEGLAESAQSNADFLKTFTKSISAVRRLAKQEFPKYSKLHQPMYRMLYTSAVTSMETYLADAFTQTVIRDNECVERLLLTTPEFKNKNYSLAEVVDWHKNTRTKVQNYLFDIVWHNISKVSQMYKAVLDIQFPNEIEAIYRAVTMRHDMVHRNGRNKKGSSHRLSLDDLESVFTAIEKFIQCVDEQITSRKESAK
jgi:Zn ribbon nucleic-acid-binding protein